MKWNRFERWALNSDFVTINNSCRAHDGKRQKLLGTTQSLLPTAYDRFITINFKIDDDDSPNDKQAFYILYLS